MLDLLISLFGVGIVCYFWYSRSFTLHHKPTKKSWYKPYNKWWYTKVYDTEEKEFI